MSKRELERAARRAIKGGPGKTLVWQGEKLAQEKLRILSGIVEGRSLSSLCRRVWKEIKEVETIGKDGKPIITRVVEEVLQNPRAATATTVMNWLETDEIFLKQYQIAMDARADIYAEEIIEIADNTTEDPNSRRVRVDSRKWVASKLKPKKYGDHVEYSGEVKNTTEIIVSAGQSLDARLKKLAQRTEPKMIDITPKRESNG